MQKLRYNTGKYFTPLDYKQEKPNEKEQNDLSGFSDKNVDKMWENVFAYDRRVRNAYHEWMM